MVAQNVDATFLTNPTTVHSPATVYLVKPPQISSTSIYTPLVQPGPVYLAPDFITSTTSVYTPSVGQITTPTGADDPIYAVVRRNLDGTSPTTLADVEPVEITWTLNEPTTARIRWPKPAYSPTDIPAISKKIQIYHDDDLMFSGPVIQPSASGDRGDVEAECADMMWLLNRRNVDAQRDNLLTNASFESGFTGWTHVGTFTATNDSTRKQLGTYSAKFVNSTDGEESFKYQSFTAGPNGVGLLLTCVGWYFIESIAGPALGSRGIYMEGVKDGVVQDVNFWGFDAAEPTGVWTRAEFTLWIPPNEVWSMNVRLYAPNGTIYYDAIQVVAMESIGSTNIGGTATSEADIAAITRLLVSFVQDSNYGKSNLYVGRNCPTNGVSLFRQYQFAEHIAFAEAVGEFVERDDGFDISMLSTPTTETFTTHTPNKGTDRSATVTLQFPGNVANYRFSRDGAGAVTRATMLGQGDGPDREEGEYVDASQLDGVILQEVRPAAPDATINSLLPAARDRVKKRRVPPLLLELDVLPSANLIHTLKVGDRVDVDVVDGDYVNVQGTHRIVQQRLNCQNNVLSVTINEEND